MPKKLKPATSIDEWLDGEAHFIDRPMMADLYRRAESRLSEQPGASRREAGDAKGEHDCQRLLHELEVHQIELELQNAELQKTRNELEVSLARYTDLYDFAPVGYFTLAPDGTILLANLTGTQLVSIERLRLVGQPFGVLVSPEFRPLFHSFLEQVFSDPAKHQCDVEIGRKGQLTRPVHIEAKRSSNGIECRSLIIDITERKRAEELVRLSEVRFRRLFETAQDGVLLLDPGTCKITDANPFMTKLLGYSRDELIGKELFEIGLLKDRIASQEMFSSLKRRREVRYEDLPLKSKDGRHQKVEVVANLYRENGHDVIQCNIRDITERKRAENQVRVSEVRYRRLFEASHDGVLLLDPATSKITDANPFMTGLLGYSHDELVGKELFEIGLLKDQAASREMFLKLKKRHQVRYEDLPLKKRGGKHQDVEVVANLYRENGHTVIQCNVRDITKRKLADDMLRRNEALFSALIGQAPVGVYVVDANLRFQQANPIALGVFKTIHPLIDRDFSEIIHLIWPKRVADQVMARFRRTLRTGELYKSPAFAERRLDIGVREFYEWQIQRVTMPAGEYGVVCFFTDITERIKAAEAQRQMDILTASNGKLKQEIIRRQVVEKALQESDQQQTRLLAQSQKMQGQMKHLSHKLLSAQEEERKRISRELHDVIAQTLVGINVHLAAFTREALDNPKGLKRRITRTQRLVDESVEIVHRFARELRPTVLDDLGLTPALHTLLKEFTKRTGIRTELTVFEGLDQLESELRTVLFRVAQEALNNVVRHAEASRVHVRIENVGDDIRMEIHDDGKSFQAERALSGRGHKRLGLQGMRERLEMVNGRLAIDSSLETGTTISASIPFVKPGRDEGASPGPTRINLKVG